MNEYLKLKKNVLKAWINQDSNKIKEDIIKFIWKDVTDCFKNDPPDKEHSLYNLFLNPINILNKNNYKNYMIQVGKYVWNNTDPIYLLFKIFYVEKKKDIIIKDIIRNIPFNLLLDIACDHWDNNMSERRLEKYIPVLKKYLAKFVPIPDSTYDGDDQLGTMASITSVDAIVSGDSDMFAYNPKIVIVDIGEDKKSAHYIKISTIYKQLKFKGYTESIIDTAIKISSADYNYYLYDNYIQFKTALKISKKFNGDYHQTFNYFCKKYGKVYDKKIANEIYHAYRVSICEESIKDSIKSVYNSLVYYINQNDNNVNIKYYHDLIKILLLFINNNILDIGVINYNLRVLKT